MMHATLGFAAPPLLSGDGCPVRLESSCALCGASSAPAVPLANHGTLCSIECRNSQKCASVKHHYEECAERVANGSKEDCVEECKSSSVVIWPHLLLYGASLATKRLPSWSHADSKLFDSLPPDPLRDSVRRRQALVQTQVKAAIFSEPSTFRNPRRQCEGFLEQEIDSLARG